MLRFWITVSLLTTVVFTGIGLAISKAWGWSEYASDELYLLYFEDGFPAGSYFLADINNGDILKLPNNETLGKLFCSPDGRTLGYVENVRSNNQIHQQLYVVNQRGIVYDEVLAAGYYLHSLANNGEVAIARLNDKGGWIDVSIVRPEGSYLAVQPYNLTHKGVIIDSSGNLLWLYNSPDYWIQGATSGGERLMSVNPGDNPRWLASEKIFSFFSYDSALNIYEGIADTTHQVIRSFRTGRTIYFVLSPDATKQAFVQSDPETKVTQIYLVDLLAGQSQWQITFDEGGIKTPLCFLTFRPQMLIADAP